MLKLVISLWFGAIQKWYAVHKKQLYIKDKISWPKLNEEASLLRTTVLVPKYFLFRGFTVGLSQYKPNNKDTS